jgi:mannosyltransferase
VPVWFRKLTVFVGPQRNEGFGLTTLEAMASELAVVGSKAGAARHLIEEDVTGHLFEIEDVDTMTARIENLMKDPKRAIEFGKAGRKRVMEKFAIEREAEGIFRVYERVWNTKKI